MKCKMNIRNEQQCNDISTKLQNSSSFSIHNRSPEFLYSYLWKSFSIDIGHIVCRFYLTERNLSRFYSLNYQMIGSIDIFGSITYCEIVSDVDGGLIVAQHGCIGNRNIKFFEGVL
jgi:hypothetical protein